MVMSDRGFPYLISTLFPLFTYSSLAGLLRTRPLFEKEFISGSGTCGAALIPLSIKFPLSSVMSPLLMAIIVAKSSYSGFSDSSSASIGLSDEASDDMISLRHLGCVGSLL